MKSFGKFLPTIFLVLAITILFSGCTIGNESEIIGTYSPDVTDAYPGPFDDNIENEDDDDAGYPVNDSSIEKPNDLPEEITVPTPSEASGIVVGKMLTESDGEPYLAPRLYLGSYIVPDEDVEDAPPLIGISADSDPVAMQAQDGTFVFSEINPGDYILLIWSPMNIVPAKSADGRGEIVISVEAGDVIDLGNVYVP